MSLFYNFIFILFAILYLPYFILKGKYRDGACQRLGFLPRAISENPQGAIWVHAVSVGEVIAARTLIGSLKAQFTDRRLVISTVTRTGNEVAKRLLAGGGDVVYVPFDLSWIVRRFLRQVRPSLLIIMETELWPNLITQAKAAGVPVVLVNGRISERSFRGYKLARPALKWALSCIDVFCMQTNQDKERLISLGAQPQRVEVCGNLKFDVALEKRGVEKRGQPPFLLIAGSTHRPEEEIILKVYKRLKERFPGLNLLLAPRHIERCAEVIAQARRLGLEPSKYTEAPEAEVVVLDKMGELRNLYSEATVVFVGGSLVKHGGQNILEPAIYAKPILFGPHMFNFRDIAGLFLKNEAAMMVKDEVELEGKLERLFADEQLRRRYGNAARKVVEENQGATERVMGILFHA